MYQVLKERFLVEQPLSEREILLLLLKEIIEINEKINSLAKKK
jgi:hypothetical protein